MLKPLPEGVTEGTIAPWFEQPGGGIQYKFDHPIELVRRARLPRAAGRRRAVSGRDGIDRVRRDLAAAGKDPDLVGWADDRDLPRIDGVLLVRREEPGVTVSTWERGRESDVRTFPSEDAAARDLRHRLLEAPAPRRTTEEERAASRERMRRKAEATKARLGASGPTNEVEDV